MKFGICNLNSIAIRKEPSDKSEMVSQLLFGETLKVIESEDQWFKIIMDFDHYEGWILKNQIIEIESDAYHDLNKNDSVVSNELVTFISNKNDNLQTITLGANLPFFKKNTFRLNGEVFDFDGKTKTGKLSKNNLVNTAYLFLNTSFLWGGRTPFGLDCSGFTQMVYKINGYSLLRDSYQQASQGKVLSFIEESDPGDLAFFDNEDGEIIHAGIILANNYIIHCHGKVRIDRLDQSGILNVDTKRHTHKLRVIKQIF
jgi:gamma-D-glutamyl-L-lysine dipeptidyl-peptidase